MTAAVSTGEAPKKTKRTPVPLNGVNTPTLLATIDAVGKQPELARFQFRATTRWVSGTHSQPASANGMRADQLDSPSIVKLAAATYACSHEI